MDASSKSNLLIVGSGVGAMVEAIARQGGDAIQTETIAFPDYSLEDHWQRGDAVRAIRRGLL